MLFSILHIFEYLFVNVPCRWQRPPSSVQKTSDTTPKPRPDVTSAHPKRGDRCRPAPVQEGTAASMLLESPREPPGASGTSGTAKGQVHTRLGCESDSRRPLSRRIPNRFWFLLQTITSNSTVFRLRGLGAYTVLGPLLAPQSH